MENENPRLLFTHQQVTILRGDSKCQNEPPAEEKKTG